ncbi:ribosome-releasing factor 2, mitochondrial-like [Anneissia japonica]|uniref:ribosome-releasing factor 2, mitochondrial-like n=1 Tax=Anneissia japonica TaxID=1529436 RepID=UPI0014259283|nr:ribosome-releasing factor 2, mitochondrial-like [Anneissia japonica]
MLFLPGALILRGNLLRCVSSVSTYPCKCFCHKGTRNLSQTAGSKEIRNIGIMAHIDAGKTTTSERMLYYAGQTRYLGDVDDGDTVTDYLPQERDRGITITSAAVTYHWKDHRINLIDTPGHVDFTVEVERCLRVLDGAVAVFDSSAGVEAQTLTVWRQANNYSIPRIAFLNKMDKHNADFEFSVRSIKEKLQVKPLVIQLPLGRHSSFEGVLNVVTMETVIWNPKGDGRNYVEQPVSKDNLVNWKQLVAARGALIEDLVELDGEFAERVLETDSFDPLQIDSDELKAVIRRVTLARGAVPVLCGSSLKNKGVQLLMDAVVDYLPSPQQQNQDLVSSFDGELCAYAFKIVHDKQRGPLVFLRIYSGELKAQSALYNLNRGTIERISRLLEVFADEHREVHTMSSGNIAVAVGLKQTMTGDTMVSSKSNLAKVSKESKSQSSRKARRKLGPDIEDKAARQLELLPGLDVPQPVFFCTIEPPSMAYQEALDHALACLQREDPSLHVRVDEETGQTILSGMGELHLEIIHDRIRKEYKIDAYLGPLQISYREAIIEPVSKTTILERTIGDQNHLVNIGMKLTPTFDFTIPNSILISEQCEALNYGKEFIDAVENGALLACHQGPLINAQMLGVEIAIESLSIGTGTSPAMVSACASQCLKSCLKATASEILEPMMNVEVTTGYATSLRTITSGTATFSLELSSYEKMSQADQDILVKKITSY